MSNTTSPTPSSASTSSSASVACNSTLRQCHYSHPHSRLIKSVLINLILAVPITYSVYKYYNHSSSSSQRRSPSSASNVYESVTSLHEYLLMHFGTRSDYISHPALLASNEAGQVMIPWDAMEFPRNCALEVINSIEQASSTLPGPASRILDLGCAVGRSSFELARYSSAVVGIDYSKSFIDAANSLKSHGSMEYRIRTEGDLSTRSTAVVDPAIDRTRTTFLCGDACNLQLLPNLGKFHVLMGANLLCRLPKPRALLNYLPQLMESRGLVIFFSPFTWMEEFTAKSEWLGGFIDSNGNEVKSDVKLRESMGELGFELIREKDLTFFIRETARKNQWSISHMMVFQMIN